MGSRLLVSGGYVVSMDDQIGELPRGDVLVEDGAIAAVEPQLDVSDCEQLDGLA